jgi:beta-mannanase
MRVELGVVALACALMAANVQRSAYADRAPDLPKLGAYDPHGLLRNDRDMSIEHVFLYWQAFRADEFQLVAADAADRGRQLMVTVEPWTRAANWTDGRETHLSDILGGGFDGEIDAICGAVGATGRPVMVSWGHEMDEREGRFPWANHDPETYQTAYRYFVDKCRALAPNARFGWTPKGEATLGAYYPGDGYVDFIGLTLFDVEAWNRDHRDWRRLEDKFGTLHSQVAGYDKPVVLAEFGSEGGDAYREGWLACARERIAKFKNVAALVYFNARETWRWPEPYGLPDWRLADGRYFRCDRREAAAPAAPAGGRSAWTDAATPKTP